MSTSEKPEFAQIETGLSCSVAGDDASFDAQITQLSRTGVSFLGPAESLKTEEGATLLIEREEGLINVALTAHVKSVEKREGPWLYGAVFEALPPDDEGQLVMLLKFIAAGSGQGNRESPRLSTRIAVKCRSGDTFKAMLNDLSRGGLSIRCPRPLQPGEPLAVEVGVDKKRDLIEVRGKVLHVTALDDGHFRVGVQFDPPSPDRRSAVSTLIDQLLGVDEPPTPKP